MYVELIAGIIVSKTSHMWEKLSKPTQIFTFISPIIVMAHFQAPLNTGMPKFYLRYDMKRKKNSRLLAFMNISAAKYATCILWHIKNFETEFAPISNTPFFAAISNFFMLNTNKITSPHN